MIEIIGLVFAFIAFRQTGKRRNHPAWPFLIAGLGGYFVIAGIMGSLLERGGAGALTMLVGGAWLLLCYGFLFFLSGLGHEKAGNSWQCPDCLGMNSASTFRCLCGRWSPEREGQEA